MFVSNKVRTTIAHPLFSSIRALRFPRRIASAALLTSALSLFATPATAQVKGDFIGGSFRICLGDDDQLKITGASDCPALPFQDNDLHGLRFGPDTATTILADDGSATFGGASTFNGGTTFNSGVQFNGQVGFSGFTTMNQLNSNSIINSGALTTNSINAGSLNVTGKGSFGGSLSSDSFSTGSALITKLQVAEGAVLNTSTTISGKLTINPGTTIDAGGNRIQNVGAPVAGADAANKNYVDAAMSGVQGNITTLTNQVADQGTRITAVENVNTVQDSRLTSVENVNTVQDTRLGAVETENTVQNTRLTSVENVNAGQDSRMTAIEAVNTTQSNQISTLQDQVGGLQSSVVGLRRNIKEANAGIAAAVALGGTMIVPDSAVSMSFNLATYRGQQGFAGSVVGRLSQRIYVNAGVAGSTMRGSTTGRVGISFGL
ncbi:MAG: YadA C-terminal domain-containing protein [Sphingomonadales bacterium]|nr:YadA C-terminal domain-containing protein [Sphingomonadales bacterium]